MRRLATAAAVAFVTILACLALAGCRSMTIEEEFRKAYPEDGYEMVYHEPVADRELAFFKAPAASGDEGLGLAVFEGSSRQGWKMTQSGSFHYPGGTVVDVGRVDLGKAGSKEVVYGYTDEKDAASIELTDRDGSVIQARIIDTDWRKIWYAVTTIESLNLKLLSEDGEVLYQIP